MSEKSALVIDAPESCDTCMIKRFTVNRKDAHYY